VKVKQAAARLEVSQTTLYALVAAGKLRCYRVGVGRGQIRIGEVHIAEYLGKAESGPIQPKAAPLPSPRLKHLRVS
jgi:excisionase family DNA binding protein